MEEVADDLEKMRQAADAGLATSVAFYGHLANAAALTAVRRELYVLVEEIKGLRADLAQRKVQF
ncbi:MAG: hypothetical protein WDM79_03195 [Terricaulis sp.]